MYGAQACGLVDALCIVFENDVEMYGAQAYCAKHVEERLFENDVEMYGAQANQKENRMNSRLRMM